MNSNNLKKIFSIENRTRYFVHAVFCLAVLSVAIFSLLVVGNKSLDKKNELAALETKKINFFESIEIKGKAVVVYDAANGKEIFSKNPDEALPLASLTKVLTAVVASGKLDDNQQIKITKEYLSTEGDSKFVVGDMWRAKDLRDFTLLTSSNDGALALAAVAGSINIPKLAESENPEMEFVKEMNAVASKIGLVHSRFYNEHGLDIIEASGTPNEILKGGAYGSARDMALLFAYTLKNYPEILEATRYNNLEFKSDAEKYEAGNTNIFVNKIPNIIASKTGYTDLAGGNLVIAFDAGINRPIIISILGSTQDDRFEDALKLASATISYINNR